MVAFLIPHRSTSLEGLTQWPPHKEMLYKRWESGKEWMSEWMNDFPLCLLLVSLLRPVVSPHCDERVWDFPLKQLFLRAVSTTVCRRIVTQHTVSRNARETKINCWWSAVRNRKESRHYFSVWHIRKAQGFCICHLCLDYLLWDWVFHFDR